MPLDDTFQKILLIGLILVLPIALYYRIKAQATREKLDRRQEGLFILATLRPVGLLLWVGIFAYTINPERMAWSAMPLPAWLRGSGVGVLGVAAPLLFWTLHSLG